MILVYDEALGGGVDTIGFGVNAFQHSFFTNGAKYPSEDDSIDSLLSDPFPFKVYVPTLATKVVLEYCATAPTVVVPCDMICDQLLLGTAVNPDQPLARICVSHNFGMRDVTVFVRRIQGGSLVTAETVIEHVAGLFVRFADDDSEDE